MGISHTLFFWNTMLESIFYNAEIIFFWGDGLNDDTPSGTPAENPGATGNDNMALNIYGSFLTFYCFFFIIIFAYWM